MALKWSKGKNWMFIVALMLTNVIVMSDLVIVPIINALYEAFPESPLGVSTVVSCTYLVVMVASLVVPQLMKKVSKRNLLIIASAVFCVFSIGGGAFANVYYLIACRVMCGLCYAVTNVTAIALINDVYTDENKRAGFMGAYNGTMSLLGSLMALSSGFLAAEGWQNSFKTFWISIPVLVMVILFIPKASDIVSSEQAMENTSQEDESQKGKQGYGSSFVTLMVIFFFYNVFYSFYSNFNSVYIAEHGLGGESLSGIVTSSGSIVSAIICFAMGALYKRFKGKTATLCCTLYGASYLLLYLMPSKLTCILGGCMLVSSYGLFMSFTYTHAAVLVPPEKIEPAIGLITSVSCVGMFVGPYIIPVLTNLMGSLTATYIICVVAAIAMAVGTLLMDSKHAKKSVTA